MGGSSKSSTSSSTTSIYAPSDDDVLSVSDSFNTIDQSSTTITYTDHGAVREGIDAAREGLRSNVRVSEDAFDYGKYIALVGGETQAVVTGQALDTVDAGIAASARANEQFLRAIERTHEANAGLALGAIDQVGDFGEASLDAFGDVLAEGFSFGEEALRTADEAVLTANAGFRNFAGNLASVAGGGEGIGAQSDAIGLDSNLVKAAAIIGGIAAAIKLLA